MQLEEYILISVLNDFSPQAAGPLDKLLPDLPRCLAGK